MTNELKLTIAAICIAVFLMVCVIIALSMTSAEGAEQQTVTTKHFCVDKSHYKTALELSSRDKTFKAYGDYLNYQAAGSQCFKFASPKTFPVMDSENAGVYHNVQFYLVAFSPSGGNKDTVAYTLVGIVLDGSDI